MADGHLALHPAGAFTPIIESGYIRLADASSMRDPKELRHGRELAIEAISRASRLSEDEVEGWVAPLESSDGRWPHVACFSACKDSTAQWRSYADNGAGYSFGVCPQLIGAHLTYPQRFFLDDRTVLMDWGLFCFPMVYDRRGQDRLAKRAAGRLFSKSDWDPHAKLQVDVFAMTMAFKSSKLCREREWRIAYGHRDAPEASRGTVLGPASTFLGNTGEVAFTPLRLRDQGCVLQTVRLGPRCESTPEETRKALEEHGFAGVRVEQAQVR